MSAPLYSVVTAIELDLEMYRGDKAAWTIGFWKDIDNTIPFDLTPFLGTLKLQLRIPPNNPRIIIELTEAAGLTIDNTNTNFLTIETLGINSVAENLNYFYDLEGVESGNRQTLLRGHLDLIEDVTR